MGGGQTTIGCHRNQAGAPMRSFRFIAPLLTGAFLHSGQDAIKEEDRTGSSTSTRSRLSAPRRVGDSSSVANGLGHEDAANCVTREELAQLTQRMSATEPGGRR